MNQTLDQREARVMAFINSKNKEVQKATDMSAIAASPEIKLRKLKDESTRAVSVCLDNIMGRLYKDALPFDDPDKDCSDSYARDEIHNFIANRTGDKNSEWYVREAIRRTNSSTLKKMLAEAVTISKNFYNEKAQDIGKISVHDLNFNTILDKEKLNDISKDLELDEISNVIHDNVQKAIKDEADKAKREDEYQKQLEEELANSLEVTDVETVEAVVSKKNDWRVKSKTVYQPSLFESIMIGKASTLNESTHSNKNVLTEAIHEFTKLNMVKALRLESFNMDGLRKMANSYLSAK